MQPNSKTKTLLSQDAFREIFQGSAEGIILVKQDGTIIMANPVSEKIFGYGEGELTGLKIEDLLPARFRENHVQYRDDFRRHPQPRRMGVGRDLMAMRKDGSEFPVEVSLSYKSISSEMFVTAFIIDITERKKTEIALRKSEEQLLVYAAELEKKVRIRTEALDHTILELEKANHHLQEQISERRRVEEEVKLALAREREVNDLKSKFVSLASHEFRTPLSAILSSASLIRKYRDVDALDKIDKHIDRIKSSVQHLTNILNDFLNLGKLEEGKVEVLVEPVVLTPFFEDVIEEISGTLKTGQEIFLTVTGTEREIQSDPKVLRNVFFNLLSNASKYSPENKPIRLEIEYLNSCITIKVIDEGIGIPPDDVRNIFERFFRASNAGNIQGTGLGLNIVKRYLNLLKADITFTSEFEKGTQFITTLPY